MMRAVDWLVNIVANGLETLVRFARRGTAGVPPPEWPECSRCGWERTDVPIYKINGQIVCDDCLSEGAA